MKSFSAVVLLAVTFFCLDTALAQRQVTHTATPVGRTATATAAPSVLQDLMDRITALESQLARISALETQVAGLQAALAVETATRQSSDVMMATVIMKHIDLLTHFSRDGNDVFITGANLDIVNGTGKVHLG